MPELPEVQTIVNDLDRKIKGLTITDVWTDWPKYFKRSIGGWGTFRKTVRGKKIIKIRRIGKNIIFDLSQDKEILIHQKLTGHLLVGHWQIKNNRPISTEKGPLAEKVNNHIHAIFWLSKNKMMGFSDLRKFGKILMTNKKDLNNLKDLKDIGPDPLIPEFKFNEFKNLVNKKRGPIKKILMDQNVVSGIGNIYSDEILFVAKIHPLKKVEKLSEKEFKSIFEAVKKILKKAVKLRGTSTSDYRDTAGKSGNYAEERLVYQREGKECPRKCGGIIKRLKIGGRSAHFCPNCQIYA